MNEQNQTGAGPELPTILPPDFKPYFEENVPSDVYHASKKFISSTAIRHFLRSPAHFYTHFVLGVQEEPTEAMEFGVLAHLCVLEPAKFKEKYIIEPEFWGYTKDGKRTNSANSTDVKQQREAWYLDQAPGAVIVTQEELEKLEGMLKSILAHPAASAVLSDGMAEVSGYARDPETGLGVRIRPDFIKNGLMALPDLKTTKDASRKAFSKEIWNRRYDVQIAMYAEVTGIILGKPVEFPSFIPIEKIPPYATACYAADPALMEKGSNSYHRALRGIKACIEANHWPAYADEVENISLPFWAFNEED